MLWIGVGVVVTGFLVYALGHIAVGRHFIWISCPIAWRWRANEEALAEYHSPYSGISRGVVYLSCGYRKTADGAGLVGYPQMLMYAALVAVVLPTVSALDAVTTETISVAVTVEAGKELGALAVFCP